MWNINGMTVTGEGRNTGHKTVPVSQILGYGNCTSQTRQILLT